MKQVLRLISYALTEKKFSFCKKYYFENPTIKKEFEIVYIKTGKARDDHNIEYLKRILQARKVFLQIAWRL